MEGAAEAEWWGCRSSRELPYTPRMACIRMTLRKALDSQVKNCITAWTANGGASGTGQMNQTESGGASVTGQMNLEAETNICKICDEGAAESCQGVMRFGTHDLVSYI